MSTEAPEIVMPDTTTSDSMLELLAPYKDSEDPNRRTHLVRPGDNGHITGPGNPLGMSGQDVVDTGRMQGKEVIALCGYVWVPAHDPDKFDACGPCFKMAEWIQQGKFE